MHVKLLFRITYLLLFSISEVASSSYLLSGECPSLFRSPLQIQTRSACPIPIDDNIGTSAAEWGPWTHRPYCIRSTRDPRTKYCVFTNTFHGENGLSVITTPEAAAMSAEMFDDPYGLSFITAGSVGNSNEDSLFEVTDIPGKGKGVIATQEIRAYETIMVDHATVLADIGFPSSVMKSQGHDLLHVAAGQLLEPGRVLNLSRSSSSGADYIEDVLRTNSFSQNLAGGPHMALYPTISVRGFFRRTFPNSK